MFLLCFVGSGGNFSLIDFDRGWSIFPLLFVFFVLKEFSHYCDVERF